MVKTAGESDRISVDSPAGPRSTSFETECVEMRVSAAGRYGNRRSARVVTAPPHALYRGNDARSMRSVRAPELASVRAAVAPAGPAPTTIASRMDAELTRKY